MRPKKGKAKTSMEKGREKMATIKKLELKRQIQKRDRTNSKFVATAGQTIKDFDHPENDTFTFSAQTEKPKTLCEPKSRKTSSKSVFGHSKVAFQPHQVSPSGIVGRTNVNRQKMPKSNF